MQMLFARIAETIRSLAPETNIAGVMDSVENLLDKSIATEEYVIRESSDEYRLVDLSHIDFEALKAKFENSRKRIEAEKLKGAINRKLVQMVRLNKSRVNYLEMFQKLIDEYNSGSYNVETLKKEKLVLDWRKRQQSRAAVRLSIEEILDRLPRSYIPELYQHKCDVVYQHIYDSYFGGRDRVFINRLFEQTLFAS